MRRDILYEEIINKETMKTKIFLAALILLAACSDKEKSEAFVIDTKIEIAVKDKDGNDLLNPQSEYYFDQSSVKVLYIVKDETDGTYSEKSALSNQYYIYKHEAGYRLAFFPNTDNKEEFPKTYIQWGENYRDTLSCKIYRGKNREIVTEVWINGVKKWEDSLLTERFFELVK